MGFANNFLLIHEAQQGCRDATYEPSRFPVAVPYPSPHRATPAYVVVTLVGLRHEQEQGIGERTFMDKQE